MIVLGCAGMADLCAHISEVIGAPVVDGVAAAVVTVEGLVRLGLRTSGIHEYATPPAKAYTGLLAQFQLGGRTSRTRILSAVSSPPTEG